MNNQTQQVVNLFSQMMMLCVFGSMAHGFMPQEGMSHEELIRDYREVLFTLYDSTSAVAGGKETPLESELSLFRDKMEELVNAGIFPKVYLEKTVPGYIDAARRGDGEKLHWYGRMIFGPVINRLMEETLKK